ncbi:phosphate ABC transporter permease PstA [Caldinitratiruptor microaerophilus]|uniref:Phosphate transport system permease protein PstA n=1 Tax=Caldinitratiruptor microaerophilus TaxID=671077 RepID=A0AA35CLV4_9FIRM|nr:phosphate ABC transporter permease PstA [Caldinitratiruptor microaerophilus]BDG61592.1 phosphate transport system permease protein PstA [Caldinitratiruptor microaerophilus]
MRPGLGGRRRAGRLGQTALALGLVLSALPALAILGLLVARGLPAVDLDFLVGAPADFLRRGGIGPALWGSVMLSGGAVAVAVPVGVGAAVYLVEYAPPGPVTRLLRAGVAAVGAVPAAVLGLFGMAAVVGGLGLDVSVLAGSLTLALLALPLVVAASEEALRAVPAEVREAAAALGATRWQVVRHAVLPAAAGTILTGAVLAFARVAGEVAPLLYTAAALWRPGPTLDPRERTMVLSYHVYAAATQVPGLPQDRLHAAALVLVILTAGLDLAATWLGRRQGRRGEGRRWSGARGR